MSQREPGSGPLVRAAGAVLWRAQSDVREIAVIHRPKYDDWTLPKGKLDPGEDDLAAALREVFEETGQRARPGPVLGEVRYVDRRGRPKVVRYWAMEGLGGSFEPGAEVDEVRWLKPADAASVLTYDHDRDLVWRFASLRDA